MEKTWSAWVLCPSKRFPGQYYYFNTRTGEKAWSWTVSSDQTLNKYVLSTSERTKPQASFGQINFPRYLHISSPRQNQTVQNSLIKFNAVNSLSHTPWSRETSQSRETPRSRESEKIVLTTNNNFKLAPPNFKPLPNNPFSSSKPECLHTDTRQLGQESTLKKKISNPILNFPPKRQSDTDIDELNQQMKKVKIEAVSPKSSNISDQDNYLRLHPNKVKAHGEFENENTTLSSASPERLVGSDNVKVSVHFLRNLSTLKHTGAWFLVPDVDILLEDLTFIRDFMADDGTCSLMIPAVVLAKLTSLRSNCFVADSRATVAAQVFEWLTKNAVCQTDKPNDCSLDDATIHKKLIECCLEAKIFHVVIITKSNNLLYQARKNNIHAYNFNALKILKQSENLFLLNPDSAKILKLPTAEKHVNNICNNKETAYKNFEIPVNRNGDRFFCSQTVTKNKAQKEILIANFLDGHTERNKSLENNVFKKTHAERNKSLENNVFTVPTFDLDFAVEDKLKKFCTEYAHLQNSVDERVDELNCSFLQIMEHCLHNILRRIPDTQFDPPCWLYQSLSVVKEHNSQNKQTNALIERLTALCGFRLSNGAMRPNIKSDQFIKILGVGILLIEQLEKISQCPDLSEYKEMLNELIEDIQRPEEFPADILLSLERRRQLGDENFRMGSDGSAEDGCYDFLISNIELAPQHEVTTNMEHHYTRHSTNAQQNNSGTCEVLNDSDGSITLLQNTQINNIGINNTEINNIGINNIGINNIGINNIGMNNIGINNIGLNCETEPSGIRSENNTPQKKINEDPVFQKLDNTVDKIRHALTRMKQFIDVGMVELNNGGIPERRKECLRERSNMFKQCADGMFQTLKMIQKRENLKDTDFGKKFAVRNPVYIDCIEHCLEQVEIMQTSFAYLLEVLN